MNDGPVVVEEGAGPRVLFATAELSPLSRVGGLADASAGLVVALRRSGVEVEVVVPDHDGTPALVGATCRSVPAPEWVGPATARTGLVDGIGEVTAISFDGLERPHPYNDPTTGLGWHDNDRRYLAFSAVVAAMAAASRPDVVHLNDWHTAAAAAWLPDDIASMLTVHNLAYQGDCDPGWLALFGPRADAFDHHGRCNPLAGGIRLADRVVAVSPAYAVESRHPATGAGLHELVRERGSNYLGIRNGIDVERWDPMTDPFLPASFDADDLDGKRRCREILGELLGFAPDHFGAADDREPVVGVLCRFVDQKGVDIACGLASKLAGIGARMVLMGRGEPHHEALARQVVGAHPDRVAYLPRSEEELAHLVVAGSDMLLVPSRFEPCGLTPMEAMRCGTVPVVNPVGGLRNTVVDADADRVRGNGFIAPAPDEVGMWLALSRAVRSFRDPARWAEIQRRGMCADWSWKTPGEHYREIYGELTGCPSVAPAAEASAAVAPAAAPVVVPVVAHAAPPVVALPNRGWRATRPVAMQPRFG